MNKTILLSRFVFLALVLITISSSCSNDESDDDTIGNWTDGIPFKGYERSGAILFTIGEVAYVGLGYDGDDYLDDIYAYNHELGYWQEIAAFPGVLRESAVAFSIGDKGYVGLGYNRDADIEELSDFWEYNSTTNTWTRLNDFAGGARYNAISFAINGDGFVGTGYDGGNTLGDFWKYNPVEDSWTEIQSFPGRKREEALAFVVGGRAYVCTGRNNGVYNSDFVRFDPTTLTWTDIEPDDDADYYDAFEAAVRRHSAVSFVLNDRVFITTGISSSGSTDNRVYEYYPATQEWVERTSFEGTGRSQAIGFVSQGHAFVGTGTSGSRRFDDVWEFKPDEEYDEEN